MIVICKVCKFNKIRQSE